jgi:hypothetical protein
MATTYGQSVLPGDTVTVEEQETVISNSLTDTMVIVGGYDASNGSVASDDVGTRNDVSDGPEAANLFGSGSELHRQTQAAYSNGIGRVVAVPVTETTVTGEDPSSGTSGELANAPVMDPNVHPEHDITDQNGNTINVSYDVDGETVDGSEAYVNPVNGKFKGDSGTTYSLDYTHGDYASAVSNAVDGSDRAVVVCTESESVGSDALSEVEDEAAGFRFQHVGFGAGPVRVDPTNYTDGISSRRAVVCVNPRGTYDGTSHVRTIGAIMARAASSPLTNSVTRESLVGVQSLYTDFTPSEIANFGEADHASYSDRPLGVTPLIDRGGDIEIVEDRTAAPGQEFRDLYKSEITDDIAFSVHEAAQAFVTEPNTPESRRLDLRGPVRSVLESAAEQRPPLLATGDGGTPYSISVSKGDTDDEATVTVNIDPLGVAKTVTVDLNVGSVSVFEGASA